VEKNHILNIYRQNANNKAQTAKILDVGINTLRRKLQEYGVE
jgi:transcriptional regulator with PAS, ATPase and Fis domain